MSPTRPSGHWARRVLRRTSAPSSPATPVREAGAADLPPALVADVVEMTTRAAADGLALEQVYEDLRIVIGLGPGDEVPTPLLRHCAVAWATAQRRPLASDDRATRTSQQLEEHLWELLASSGSMPLPAFAVVIDLVGSGSLLETADLLEVAGRTAATVFGQHGERVATLPSTAPADRSSRRARVVALAHADKLDARTVLVRAQLEKLAVTNGTVTLRVYDLTTSTAGVLDALREVLEEEDS